MKIEVKIDGIEAAMARLDGLKAIEKRLAPVLKLTAQTIVTTSRANIRAKTAPDGTPYQALADSTLRARKASGQKPPYRPLIWSGNMIRDMFGRALPLGIEFGAPQHYLVFHQQGSDDNKRPPRRAIFPITKEGAIETQGSGGQFWNNFRDKIIKALA